jgi:hypothetical protein
LFSEVALNSEHAAQVSYSTRNNPRAADLASTLVAVGLRSTSVFAQVGWVKWKQVYQQLGQRLDTVKSELAKR